MDCLRHVHFSVILTNANGNVMIFVDFFSAFFSLVSKNVLSSILVYYY